jgi:hypothetical protein
MDRDEIDEALIHREHLKMYLDLFSEDYENVADAALDKAIISQREVYKKHRENLISLTAKKARNENEAIQNELDQYYAKMSLTEVEDEVFALFELKIIYTYKHLEIQLGLIAQNVFDYEKEGKFSNWDVIKKFYSDGNIKFSELKSIEKIEQLRKVNNTLKHSGRFIGQKIRNIPDFKGLTHLQIEPLKKFYERVQCSPKEFISALASAIYNQLFNDDPSTNISREFDIQCNDLIMPD